MKPFRRATAAAFTLAACAADPATVAPAYVSPVAYAGLDCRALAAEATRLNARIATVTGQQQDAAAPAIAYAPAIACAVAVAFAFAFAVANAIASACANAPATA
jgi:hypothetical protein